MPIRRPLPVKRQRCRNRFPTADCCGDLFPTSRYPTDPDSGTYMSWGDPDTAIKGIQMKIKQKITNT